MIPIGAHAGFLGHDEHGRREIGPFEQRLGASQVMDLPGREHHIDGIAERIDQDMDFGG